MPPPLSRFHARAVCSPRQPFDAPQPCIRSQQFREQQEILERRRNPKAREKYLRESEENRRVASREAADRIGWQQNPFQDPIKEWKKRKADDKVKPLGYEDVPKGGIQFPMASFGVGGEFGTGGKYDSEAMLPGPERALARSCAAAARSLTACCYLPPLLPRGSQTASALTSGCRTSTKAGSRVATRLRMTRRASTSSPICSRAASCSARQTSGGAIRESRRARSSSRSV